MSGYLGSIGFGYPAAMGAWAAAPGPADRRGHRRRRLRAVPRRAHHRGEVRHADHARAARQRRARQDHQGAAGRRSTRCGRPRCTTPTSPPTPGCAAPPASRCTARDELDDAMKELFAADGPALPARARRRRAGVSDVDRPGGRAGRSSAGAAGRRCGCGCRARCWRSSPGSCWARRCSGWSGRTRPSARSRCWACRSCCSWPGSEVDLRRFRGSLGKRVAVSLAISVVAAAGVVAVLAALGVGGAVVIGVALLATSLGLVVPVLADAGALGSADRPDRDRRGVGGGGRRGRAALGRAGRERHPARGPDPAARAPARGRWPRSVWPSPGWSTRCR